MFDEEVGPLVILLDREAVDLFVDAGNKDKV